MRYDVEGRARAGGASSFPRIVWKKRVKSAYLSNITTTPPANQSGNPGDHDWPWHRHRPFRAFMQQRAADEAPGKNWHSLATHTLRKISSTRWNGSVRQRRRADAHRSRLVARSKRKIYVQDKLREQGAELWRWINAVPTFMSAATLIAWRKTLSRTSGSDCRIWWHGHRSGG